MITESQKNIDLLCEELVLQLTSINDEVFDVLRKAIDLIAIRNVEAKTLFNKRCAVIINALPDNGVSLDITKMHELLEGMHPDRKVAVANHRTVLNKQLVLLLGCLQKMMMDDAEWHNDEVVDTFNTKTYHLGLKGLDSWRDEEIRSVLYKYFQSLDHDLGAANENILKLNCSSQLKDIHKEYDEKVKKLTALCDTLLSIDGAKEKVKFGYGDQKELLGKLYNTNIAKVVSGIKDNIRGSNLSKENADQLIVDVVSKVEHYVYEIYEFFVNDN